MRSELQYLDKVLSPIADEREKLKVELRSTPRITVFQRAEPPKARWPCTPAGRGHGGRRRLLRGDLSGLVVGCAQAADQFAGRSLAGSRADRGWHRASAAAEIGPTRAVGQTSSQMAELVGSCRRFHRRPAVPAQRRRGRAGGDGLQRHPGRGKDHAGRATGNAACPHGRADLAGGLRLAATVDPSDLRHAARTGGQRLPAQGIGNGPGRACHRRREPFRNHRRQFAPRFARPAGQRRHHRRSSPRPVPPLRLSSSMAARSFR